MKEGCLSPQDLETPPHPQPGHKAGPRSQDFWKVLLKNILICPQLDPASWSNWENPWNELTQSTRASKGHMASHMEGGLELLPLAFPMVGFTLCCAGFLDSNRGPELKPCGDPPPPPGSPPCCILNGEVTGTLAECHRLSRCPQSPTGRCSSA